MNQQPAEQGSPHNRAHPPTFTNDCRLVDDAIEEYTLGIVGPSQEMTIDRHLIGCHRCSEIVESYRQTVAALALAVPLIAPPASARTALFARIAVTPQSVASSTSVFFRRSRDIPNGNAANVEFGFDNPQSITVQSERLVEGLCRTARDIAVTFGARSGRCVGIQQLREARQSQWRHHRSSAIHGFYERPTPARRSASRPTGVFPVRQTLQPDV